MTSFPQLSLLLPCEMSRSPFRARLSSPVYLLVLAGSSSSSQSPSLLFFCSLILFLSQLLCIVLFSLVWLCHSQRFSKCKLLNLWFCSLTLPQIKLRAYWFFYQISISKAIQIIAIDYIGIYFHIPKRRYIYWYRLLSRW